MSNYITEYSEPHVSHSEFEHACRNSSIVDAAKDMASARSLTGRELEINQELEITVAKELNGSTFVLTVGLTVLMMLGLLMLVTI